MLLLLLRDIIEGERFVSVRVLWEEEEEEDVVRIDVLLPPARCLVVKLR